MKVISIHISIFMLTILILCSASLYALENSKNSESEMPPEVRKQIDSFIEKSNYYFILDPDSSDYYEFRALSLARIHSDSISLGSVYFLIGDHLFKNEKLLLARESFLKSLDLFINTDLDSLKSEIYLQLGMIHGLHDDYGTAMEYLIRSLHIAEDNGNSTVMFEVYSWIALLFNATENRNKTIEYYNKALDFRKKLNEDEIVSETFLNLAFVHVAMKEYKKAEEYYLLAVDEMVRNKDSTWLAAILIEIGDVKYSQGQFKSALDYYSRTMEAIKKSNKRNMLLGNYYLIKLKIRYAREAIRLRDYQRAIGLLTDATHLAKEEKYNILITEASHELSKIYRKTGNIDSALLLFLQADRIEDSIFDSFQISETVRIELEYNHFRALQEKKIKRLQMELAYNKKIQNYQLLILAVIFITILLILIFIIIRSRQKSRIKEQDILKDKLANDKKNLQKIIEEKNRELTTSVIFLLKKNNFLHNFTNDLKESIRNNKHAGIKSYQDLLKRLNESLSRDAWEEFETRFNEVHHDFNKNLLRDFPSLTPNELKLCAFLKLNMTTKDIETITYQSNNTITVGRYRLRTKLGLNRDDNLVTFLSKY